MDKINITTQNTEYDKVIDLWNLGKPLIKNTLKKLNKKISIIIHGGSFPSLENEDFGIGSPYNNGSKRLYNFFEPIVDMVQLGPWGKTTPGANSYNTHSPYTALLESWNPFFIDFKSLTTSDGGKLLTADTYLKAINARPKNNINRIEFEYVEIVVTTMLDEVYKTFTEKLVAKDEFALTLEKELLVFERENKGILLDSIYYVLQNEYSSYDFKTWDTIDSILPILIDKNAKLGINRLNIIREEHSSEIEKYLLTQLITKKHMDSSKENTFKYIADKQVAIEGPDLWKLQDIILFEIDNKQITLGVEPDMFSSEGRNWGMKIFDVKKLFNKDNELTLGGKKLFNIFKNVFSKNQGGVRIDHFQGIINPFIFVDNSASYHSGAGRLFSSFYSPVLHHYAIREENYEERLNKYALFFDKIILDAAKSQGLDKNSIIPEDLGAITDETRAIIEKFQIPSMCITQYVNPDDPHCIYNAMNAKEKDLISTGTHDGQPLIEHMAWLDSHSYSRLVELLCRNLNIENRDQFYNETGRTTALKAKFAELFMSKANNVQLFFTHLFGLNDYYNKPGDKRVDKWRSRIPNDFEKEYFCNILNGTGFDFFDALIKSLEGKNSPELAKDIENLKIHHKKLLLAIEKMLIKELSASVGSDPNIIGSLNHIKIRNKIFPTDCKYRNAIAKAIDTSPENLSQIIGTEELSYILKNSSSLNFCTQGIDENTGFPNNKDFKINLHFHTTESDGKITVEELLDKQVAYAKTINKKVVFAISNHDSISDVKKAIKIISSEPKKYDNILFVPCVEINTKYVNPKITGEYFGPELAVQLEMVGYAINPFDPLIENFIKNISSKNEELVTFIINEYNNWGLDADINEAKTLYPHLKCMGSPGVIDSLRKYIQYKFYTKGWIWKDDSHDAEYVIRNIIPNRYGCDMITPATPTYEEVIDTINSSGFGMLGIAHPANIDLRSIQVSGEYAIKTVISDILDRGCKCIERNYQYVLNDNESMPYWIKMVNNFIDLKYPSILKSGGIDNHGTNIFSRNV